MSEKKPDFFLPPQNYSDFDRYRGAIRKARGIKTLIDGKAIFSDMEREIIKAKKNVLIAFWSFDPNLKLQSREAKKLGKTWSDLLITKAKNGVKIRMFLTDFDPMLQFEKHAGVWLRYRLLISALEKSGLPKKDNFQIVIVRHEAEVPTLTTKIAGLTGLDGKIAGLINTKPLKERILIFANAPGLWTPLKWDHKSNKAVAKKKDTIFPVFPASHHQKYIWIDGKTAFVGGINLINENVDTPKHLRKNLPWHDVFVRLEGGPLRDIRRNFIGLWNKERSRMSNFIRKANTDTNVPKGMPIWPSSEVKQQDLPMSAPDRKKRRIPGQIHRTISRNSSGNVPDVFRKDVIEGYLKAIDQAKNFIYIENQYLRSQTLADAIIARHTKIKRLKTIVVLPKTAEELIKGNADAITLHGAGLQHEAIKSMQTAIGSNLGIYALALDKTMVYVHSKLLIIDDKYSNIGSANANPRSYLMDSELNFAWQDTSTAKQTRLKLWRELLGPQSDMPKWKPHQFVGKWNKIAERNSKVAPKRRKGLIIPFENVPEGKKNPMFPDEFASLMQSSDARIV